MKVWQKGERKRTEVLFATKNIFSNVLYLFLRITWIFYQTDWLILKTNKFSMRYLSYFFLKYPQSWKNSLNVDVMYSVKNDLKKDPISLTFASLFQHKRKLIKIEKRYRTHFGEIFLLIPILLTLVEICGWKRYQKLEFAILSLR